MRVEAPSGQGGATYMIRGSYEFVARLRGEGTLYGYGQFLHLHSLF